MGHILIGSIAGGGERPTEKKPKSLLPKLYDGNVCERNGPKNALNKSNGDIFNMASKRHIRRKSCEGKQRYTTVEAAKKALCIATRIYGRNGVMNVYHCKFCKGVHLGHAPNFIQRRFSP